MSRRIATALLFAAALGAVTTVERVAHATSPQEQQLAQALFEEGRRLMDKKRYAEACPKLAESQRLDPGGGTLLNLAICHEKEGRLATAKIDYDDALTLATKDGRKDRQQIARERLAAIEPLIPRISVVVATASDTEGLEVKLDGLVLRRAAWGVATPVDPGAHTIEASATNRKAWSTSIEIEASQKKAIDVPPLVLLAPLPQGETSGTFAPVPLGGLLRPIIVSPEPEPGELPPSSYVASSPRANPVFYTALTLTVIAAGTSAVTGILALSAKSDATTAGCLPDRKYCPDQAAFDTADRATTMAWISTVTLGFAAVGVLVLIVAPSKISATRVRGSSLAGGGMFDLSGSF